MPKKIKGWHFLSEDYRLRGGGKKVKAGDLITVKGPPVLCSRGLHGSRRVVDALRFAPGPILCRVVIGGEVIEGEDKLVGTERYVEWTLDATWLLHEFSCWCAERALIRAGVKTETSWNAIAVKRRWLQGEATDEELAATRAAAWSATWAVDAAKAAALAATWAADAADAAAWAAAADDAARDVQESQLQRMIRSVPWEK